MDGKNYRNSFFFFFKVSLSLTFTFSSAVFQAGGLVVIIAEVARKAYLASIVPVIVNAVLNEHQIVVDIVAFVNKGDFPRSRLGEKQRGKILAGWVSRKMRTMAQFAIKDMDLIREPGDHPHPGGDNSLQDHHRASMGSFRSANGPAAPGSSSLRNVDTAPQILEQQELEMQQYQYYQQEQQQHIESGMATMSLQSQQGYGGPMQVPVEMPADEIAEMGDNQTTPTNTRQQAGQQGHGYDLPDFAQFDLGLGGTNNNSQPANTNTGSPTESRGYGSLTSGPPPQIRLPGVDGRESLDDWTMRPQSGGGLRVVGVNGVEQEGRMRDGGEDGDDWTRDAYMSMNLAGTLGGGQGQQQGR